MSDSRKKIVIIGGGITGLSTAYFLQESLKKKDLAVDCVLIEAEGRLGGKIRSERVDEFIIEGGPDSFITQKKWGVELCRRLDLTDSLVQTNPIDKSIFVLSKGKLQAFPEGFNLMVPSRMIPFMLTPLISPLGKLRMGMDLLIPKRQSSSDESIAAFVRRRLGEEAVQKFAQPILAGIFAGDAEKLSMQATFPQFSALEQKYGSLIKGMRQARGKAQGPTPSKPALSLFVTLREGLSSLPLKIREKLDEVEIISGQAVTAVARVDHRYAVDVGPSRLFADAVVMTTHAHRAAEWIVGWDPRLSDLLKAIPYVSTATVSLGFKKADVPHALKGFGFVVPRQEACTIMASTWSSTKFPGRAPKDHVLIRTFLGGAGRGDLVEREDKDLVARVREDLRKILGIVPEPVVAKVFRWMKANPQYAVGHLDHVGKIEKQTEAHAGLYLAGAAYRGVGIPDCIEQGMRTAEKITTWLTAGRMTA